MELTAGLFIFIALAGIWGLCVIIGMVLDTITEVKTAKYKAQRPKCVMRDVDNEDDIDGVVNVTKEVK